ncbi:MAG: MoaD/ThiS family protein [Candidatus Thorarchaeota archaeon]
MKFKSFGPIRRALDSQVIYLDMPDGSVVRDAIARVVDLGGTDLEDIIMDGDRVSGNLIIMLNRKDVSTLNGEGTPLSEGDEIALLPHVQGG